MAKRKGPIGPCNLCGFTRELRHSHVIPELMYVPLYDTKHSAVAILSNRKGPQEILQKGHREYLLCQDCETLFSGWETPAAKTWRAAVQQLRGASPETVVTVSTDYRTFKLFSLSLIWRASIAQHDNFSAVDLGLLEPVVRSMLLSATPGAVTEFPSLAVAYSNLDQLVGVIGPSGGGVWNGYTTFRLNISGIQWLFFAEPSASSLLPHPAVTHKGFTVVVSRDTETGELHRLATNIKSL